MKERPLIFSAPMVRAILDGRKTQTRRIISPRNCYFGSAPREYWQHGDFSTAWVDGATGARYGVQYLHVRCHVTKHGKCARCDQMDWPGSAHRLWPMWWPAAAYCGPEKEQPAHRLWVKETWWRLPEPSTRQLRDGADTWPKTRVAYAADGDDPDVVRDWGWKLKSSIFMPRSASRITLEITDVRVQRLLEISEDDAISEGIERTKLGPRSDFLALWASINGNRSLLGNPWLWALTFRRIN